LATHTLNPPGPVTTERSPQSLAVVALPAAPLLVALLLLLLLFPAPATACPSFRPM
jgi:hypothetical protein